MLLGTNVAIQIEKYLVVRVCLPAQFLLSCNLDCAFKDFFMMENKVQ